MAVLTSQVERESEEFSRRRARMDGLVAELRERTVEIEMPNDHGQEPRPWTFRHSPPPREV